MSAADRNARQQALATSNTTANTPDENDTDDVSTGSTMTGRNFTVAELIFPATVLRFAKQGNAYELITFRTQQQFVAYLANTAGVYRWIRNLNQETIAKSIEDVPTPVLLAIYNRTRGEEPLDRFRNRETAEKRTAEILMNVSVQYEDTDMAKKTSETGQTKAEAKAAERAAAKAKKEADKAAEKEANKATNEAKRADGVIGTIKAFLETETGATQTEILDNLVTKFPARTRDGMSSTVKIQCSRLAKSTGREIVSKNIEGRGRVYKFADKGAIPGVEVVAKADTPAPAATPAAPSAAPAEAAPASA
jgi:ribosomal protein L31E